MRALEQPYTPPGSSLVDGTPLPALLLLAAAWSVAVLTLPAPAARGVGLAVAHGGMLGTALAWTADDGTRGRWAPLEAALVLAAATLCARLLPGGSMGYLGVPAWLLWRQGGCHGRGAEHARAVLAGAVFGLFLGAHLLVNASLTLGVHVRPGRPATLLAWLAYDVGANVLSAEMFFRAGLFSRAHRRWSFAAAAALSTAASVARYLLDPLLPHTPGLLAGAIFYLPLLGVGNCCLLARHRSLAGPFVAALLFFAAYRLLAH